MSIISGHCGHSESGSLLSFVDHPIRFMEITDPQGRRYTVDEVMEITASEQLLVVDANCPTCSTLLEAMAIHGSARSVLVLLLSSDCLALPGTSGWGEGYSVYFLDRRLVHFMGVESVPWVIEKKGGHYRGGPGAGFLFQGKVHVLALSQGR